MRYKRRRRSPVISPQSAYRPRPESEGPGIRIH
jgi:hypothetical protein